MVKCEEIKILLILAILFAPLSFSCAPGYEENASIQVLDARGRPIANASVEITYQIDVTSGKGNSTTFPKFTDSNGMANFTFRNQEFVASKVNCKYEVFAVYDNKNASKTVDVDHRGPVSQLNMSVYSVTISALDQNRNPMPGALVYARDIKMVSGTDGRASFSLGSGPVNITLVLNRGSILKSINITNDTEYSFETGIYDLRIHAIDDQEMPVVANVDVDGARYSTDSEGILYLREFINSMPEVKLLYGGVEKSISPNLRLQPDWYAVYDIHAPAISGLSAKEEAGLFVLSVHVADEGKRASGLAPDGIRARYSFDGNDYVAVAYPKSQGEYEIPLPAIGKSGVAEISLDAMDSEGNIRSVRGYFSVTYETNTTMTPGGGGTGQGDSGKGIDPLYIGGAIALLLIVAAAVYFIRKTSDSE